MGSTTALRAISNRNLLVGLLAAALASGCGGDDDLTVQQDQQPASSAAATTTTSEAEEAPELCARYCADVQQLAEVECGLPSECADELTDLVLLVSDIQDDIDMLTDESVYFRAKENIADINTSGEEFGESRCYDPLVSAVGTDAGLGCGLRVLAMQTNASTLAINLDLAER